MNLSIIFLALLLFFSGSALAAYPNESDLLNSYVLLKNAPIVNLDETQALINALEAHITELISEERWDPLHEGFGVDNRPTTVMFTEPSEIFYALSLAYPFLSLTLQSSVNSYLTSRWSDDTPYSSIDYGQLDEGGAAQRNYHRIDDGDVSGPGWTAAISNGHTLDNFIGSRNLQIFPLYLFAQNTSNWSLISDQYSNIKNACDGLSTSANNENNGNFMRDASSFVGCIRIADYLSQTTDKGNWLSDLSSLINDLIDYQDAEGTQCSGLYGSFTPTGGSDFNFWFGCLSYAADGDSGHKNIISRYYGMTPVVGRVLGAYSTGSSDIANFILRNVQGFYLAGWDHPVYEGEGLDPYYMTHQALFYAMSYVSQVNFATHKLMIDRPICRADIYYIERLVRAIESSGSQNWVSYSEDYDPFEASVGQASGAGIGFSN